MRWLTLTVSGLLPSYCHMNSRLGMSRWMGGEPHSSAGLLIGLVCGGGMCAIRVGWWSTG
jgi:hypothetical protein